MDLELDLLDAGFQGHGYKTSWEASFPERKK